MFARARAHLLSLPLLLAAPLGVAGCDEIKKELKAEADKQRGDDLVAEGETAFLAGHYTEAIEKFEAAQSKGLKYKKADEVETMIGNAFLQLDEHERAVEHHLAALEINGKNHMAMVNLGGAYRQLGRFDEAEDMYTKAASLAPDYPELHASLGALYVHQGKHELAEKALRRSLELAPELPVAHANLSITLAHLGRFEDARAELKRATELGYRNQALAQSQIDSLEAANPGSAAAADAQVP